MPSTKIKGNEEARNTRKDIISSKELCKIGDLEDSDAKIPSNNDLRSKVEQQRILFKLGGDARLANGCSSGGGRKRGFAPTPK